MEDVRKRFTYDDRPDFRNDAVRARFGTAVLDLEKIPRPVAIGIGSFDEPVAFRQEDYPVGFPEVFGMKKAGATGRDQRATGIFSPGVPEPAPGLDLRFAGDAAGVHDDRFLFFRQRGTKGVPFVLVELATEVI
jgi:hypothetical protein